MMHSSAHCPGPTTWTLEIIGATEYLKEGALSTMDLKGTSYKACCCRQSVSERIVKDRFTAVQGKVQPAKFECMPGGRAT